MFIIRDFGTGLSEQELTTLYTTYFESTKNTSNDYVGALGLGSKSPFCYVDAFTITSWHGGREFVFTAFINESGFPHITKMQEKESFEPTGMKITVPVKSTDFGQFQSSAKEVFQYFPVSPIITGARVDLAPIEYVMTVPNIFGVRSNKNRDYRATSHGIRAVMGPVAYPITNLVQGFTYEETTMLNCTVDLFFEMGEIEIAASREALSMNKETIAAIKRKLKEMQVAFNAKIKLQVDACPTLWQAWLFYAKIASSLDHRLVAVASSCMYAGVPISTVNIKIPSSNDWIKRVVCNATSSYSRSAYSHEHKRIDSKGNLVDTSFRFHEISEDTEIFIVDSVFQMNRLKAVKTNRTILVFPVRQLGESTKALSSRMKDATILKQAENIFGGAKIQYTSDIEFPKEIIESVKTQVIKKDQLYVFDHLNLREYAKVEVDLTKGGLYLPFKGGSPERSAQGIAALRADAIELKILDEKQIIYGVPVRGMETILSLSNWTEYISFLTDKVKERIQKYGEDDLSLYQIYADLFGRYSYRTRSDIVAVIQHVNSSPVAKKTITSKRFLKCVNLYEKFKHNDETANLLGIARSLNIDTLGKKFDSKDITVKYEKDLSYYPLLDHLEYRQVKIQDIVNYINMIGD